DGSLGGVLQAIPPTNVLADGVEGGVPLLNAVLGAAKVAKIAYELLKRSHGRGYATEAARAVLGAAGVTGRSRLWATVRTWNAPSFRVLEKLEFQRDHVSEDERGELVWLTRALP
ncbi:MAG: GNAT family N-acetyltransferase, partial [Pseudonocardiaceae bacterium]